MGKHGLKTRSEPAAGRWPAAAAAVFLHAAVLGAAALSLAQTPRGGDRGVASVAIRLTSAAPASGGGAAEAAPTAVDRLADYQQSLSDPAASNSTRARPQPASAGEEGLAALLGGGRPGSGEGKAPGGADDPYARASFEQTGRGGARATQDRIQARADACAGRPAEPFILEVRLGRDGRLLAEPRVIGPAHAAATSQRRAAEARAIAAVVRCAPYPGTPGAYRINIG